MPTHVRSHAKINLGLAIGPPRPDGFHGLTTIYQTLEAHDIVTVSARPAAANDVQLTSNDGRVPTDSRNTAFKMAELALAALERTAEVRIHIEKRLPVQGGLGAGSANAVAALIGLERELGIGRDPIAQSIERGAPSFGRFLPEEWDSKSTAHSDWPKRRLELAAQVGSDVPLFLIGGTVLGVDRGQIVRPLPDLEPLFCLLAIPATGVSTPQAFRDWDALCNKEGLTGSAGTDKLNRLSRACLRAFGVEAPQEAEGQSSSGVLLDFAWEDLAGPPESVLVRTGITSWIQNDFERVVFPQHPSLAEIKRILAADATPEAALYAALSGSGSALFGLYKSRGDAEQAADRISKQMPGVVTRVTQTLPRKAYWNRMVVE